MFLRLPSLCTVEAILDLYRRSFPTNKKVLELLVTCEPPSTNAERETFSFLQRFVRGMKEDMLEKFLRFSTGSNVICVDQIMVTFTKLDGFSRRPVAHTCGAFLEVPCTYSNYTSFRGEWNNILKQGDWEMDFI